MSRLTAQIVGGGVAGLASAAALARRGWTVSVHEQAAELREVGAGIELLEAGIRALDALGIAISDLGPSAPIRSFAIYNELSQPITSSRMSESARCFVTPRTGLHRALYRAAESAGAEITCGSKVLGATPDGDLLLADGTVRHGDLVIGADGIGSEVRTTLGLRAFTRDVRYISKRCIMPWTDADPQDEFPGYWSGSRRVGIAPCGEGLLYVFLYCRPDDRDGCALPIDRDSWTESFPSLRHIFMRIKDNEVDVRPLRELVCGSWSRGRAVLIGDAAHGMTPHLGQAACIAIESAVVLAMMLDRTTGSLDDIQARLRRWEAVRRPGIDAARRYGHAYNYLMTGWPSRHTRIRSSIVRALYRSRSVRTRIESVPALPR